MSRGVHDIMQRVDVLQMQFHRGLERGCGITADAVLSLEGAHHALLAWGRVM